jgi:biotin transport system substrate-specific component
MQTLATTRRTLPALAGTVPGRIALGLAATLVVAAAAHVSFPLFFTPVPLTLQPLAVLGVGLALGPVTGFVTMLAYLAEGAMGLPVFSPAGPGGLAQLIGPTAGFLWAYPLVAAIAGGATRVLSRVLSSFVAAALACTIAVALLFACGAGWLMLAAHLAPYLAPHLSLHAVWIEAVAPFLPGEAIKILAAAGIYSTLARSLSRQTPRQPVA